MKAIAYLTFLLAVGAQARSLSGLWDGTVVYDDYKIPFLIEFSENGNNVTAAFFNGDDQVTSTSGTLKGSELNVNFAHYATQLTATYEGDEVTGTYGSTRNGFHAFEAHPHTKLPDEPVSAPSIGGVWTIPNESPKGEHAWRFIVQQKGAHVSAAILRVDGDTGALSGDFHAGKWVLNHFDGARALMAEVTPNQDGSLDIDLRGFKTPPKHFRAVRASEAKAQGLPEPTDPDEQTQVKDPAEPFRFSFPDLHGNVVTESDARFRNKVVLVNITGSWCPNCHDEAPYLEELYRKYHSRGLEIVAIDFEEAEQLKDPTRLPAFIKKYGIEYTYLLAGQPSELQSKIPQAVNLNSWPTTFFVARDGRVRAIHAGFAAAASGEFNIALKRETESRIEKLLSENLTASR